MRRALPLLIGLALLAGLWLLPDLAETPRVPDSGQDRARAVVVDADAGTDAAGQRQLSVRLTEGERAGEEVIAVIQQPGMALPGAEPPRYEAGDEVVVSIFSGAAGGFVTVDEPWRVPLLAWLAAGFAAAVMLVGGLRGARSLVALAFTLLVVGKVLIPLLLAGWSPLPLAIGTAAGVTVVTLLLTGIADDIGAAQRICTEKLETGEALEYFRRNVELQGGDPAVCDDPELLVAFDVQKYEIVAESDGFVNAIDTMAIGDAMCALGGGRTRAEDTIDHAVGFATDMKIGDRVERGHPVATVFCRTAEQFDAVREKLISAYSIGPTPSERTPLVLDAVS